MRAGLVQAALAELALRERQPRLSLLGTCLYIFGALQRFSLAALAAEADQAVGVTVRQGAAVAAAVRAAA